MNKGLTRKHAGKSIIFGMIAAVIILIGMAAQAGAMMPEEPDGPEDETRRQHESALDDFLWMRKMIEALSHEEVKLVATNYGVIHDRSELPAKLREDLFSALPGIARLEQNAHSWVMAKPLSEDTDLYVSAHLDGDTTVIVMQLLSASLASNDSYGRWFAQLDDAWEALGFIPNWRVNLQTELSAARTPDDIWDLLNRSGAEVNAIEEYRDGGTISRTYQVPFMHGLVNTAGHAVHLQAAVHQSSEDQSTRVTFGSPLITIEY